MQEIKIEGYNIPIRLDRYLKEINPNLTQGIIEKSLRKGDIKVNGAKAKASLRVKTGDTITSSRGSLGDRQNLATANELKHNSNAKILAQKLISKYKIFENKHFYAFNKPGGLATQGGSKISISLDDAFKILGLRLVHRLDKDTSGIILAAKTRDDAIILTKAFEERQFEKTYLACISPVIKSDSGTIKSYVRKKDKHVMESIKHPSKDAVEAITHYENLCSKQGASLVEFKPLTGRMHQLRLHAKDLGSPIVGDKKYGGKKDQNLMLHAHELKLHKSIYGKEITIKCELPEYFLIKL